MSEQKNGFDKQRETRSGTEQEYFPDRKAEDALPTPDTPSVPSEENEGKKVRKGLFRFLPVWFFVIVCIAALCAVCHLLSLRSTAFANFMTDHVASVGRFLLAKLTNALPFSLAETLILCLPLIVVLFLLWAHRCLKQRKTGRPFFVLGGALLVYYCMFVLTFACGYRTDRIDIRLGLTRQDVSAEELAYTAQQLTEEVSAASKKLTYGADGFSVMPYSFDTMSEKLCDAYEALHTKYSFIQHYRTRVKPVALSVAMSYCHVTGIYTTVTGEANLNIDFPDYSLPYTAAHELAHQRGISREDEANFVAFLVCLESEDDYIRYSGTLGMLEYTLNALYSASPELYSDAYRALPRAVRGELSAYAEFYKKYQHSTAGKVNEAINDTYLKFQGTEGTRSYGLAVDLAVAYYHSGKN